MSAIVFPDPARPRVSILMVTYGGWSWVERALRSVATHTAPGYEVIVVDNASADGLADELERNVKNATLVRNAENRGFGLGSNQAADRARGGHLVFLNSDAYVHAGWLPPLLESASALGVGAVAPRILNDDGTLQEAGCLLYAGGETEFYGYRENPDDDAFAYPRDVDYASAACLLVKRSAFAAQGGFDPEFAPAYYEDVDLCLRLRRDGLRCIYEPRSTVSHSRGLSTSGPISRASAERNGRLFRERWRGLLEHRPRFQPPEVSGITRRRIAARDALADARVLVVADRPLDSLLADLARRRPACVTTLLALTGAAPGGRPDLAKLGIEVVDPGSRAAEWLAGRHGHYDVVVVAARSLDAGIERALAESQPQAVRLDEPPPEGTSEALDEALARAGVGPATASR